MKLHADAASHTTVQAHGPGWIVVGGERIAHSVALSSTGERFDWPGVALEALNATHFDALLRLNPELVIFGSGTKHRFIHPALHANLMAQRVGLETMDTAAACRTYNILAQEGRRVVAALLIESPAEPTSAKG
ncbi:MAG: Mth938-like domain-containing protein [Burkholderiaceae bacterium]|nr:Mth938-like domain-containing protein [Burkholderiaceae bacterium]MDP3133211.1 Mth938-like domain-containing protein [Burkholderiaceae bacterium]